MQKYIELARPYLKRSWLKRESTECNTASIAIAKNGLHASGKMESRTHLLDVTSEQAALAIATARGDPCVSEVITIAQGDWSLSILAIKIMVDHARRVGTRIAYSAYSVSGEKLFSCTDVSDLFYTPGEDIIENISSWNPEKNEKEIEIAENSTLELRAAAIRGSRFHFSSGTATKYGAAVEAEGKLYSAGAYSSYDRRLNLHAEMVAALCAIADGNKNITKVGIISNKFKKEPVQMCGCCRQFFSEIEKKTGRKITIIGFAYETDSSFETTLDKYLPGAWHSGDPLAQK
ncbi:hypothetical protein D6825_03420 [Candidatus Woesearchaeota archaeon]|nr:MAG: hypothetical protein D6825_03420 [Candidatus Woesearchaeota archaeon]